MRQENPFKALRIRPFGGRIALMLAVALLGSLFSGCFCGSSCGSQTTQTRLETTVEVDGCCSSCAPKGNRARKSCCDTESGVACATVTLADQLFIQPAPVAPVHVMDLASTKLVQIQPASLAKSDHSKRPAESASGPPVYIQLEVLRI